MRYDDLKKLPEAWAAYYVDRQERQRTDRSFSDNRCWGISSDAMVEWALGSAPEPSVWEYPADPSDLAACQRAYDLAPGSLQLVMDPLMAKYRAHVDSRYPQATERVAYYLRTGIDVPAGDARLVEAAS